VIEQLDNTYPKLQNLVVDACSTQDTGMMKSILVQQNLVDTTLDEVKLIDLVVSDNGSSVSANGLFKLVLKVLVENLSSKNHELRVYEVLSHANGELSEIIEVVNQEN
jgi:hypothetical protein